MKKPAVLFTASTSSHIASFHLPYLQEFSRLGWEVHVACGGPERELPGADRVIYLPFEKKMRSPKNFLAARQLHKEIVENRYSLVITHTSLAAFFTRAALVGVKNRPPTVNMVHGYLFDDQTGLAKRSVLSLAERIMAPRTELVLTMNSWDYECAKRNSYGREVHNIPGIGVDYSRLDANATDGTGDIRKSLGLGPKDFLMIYAAEFSDRKNQKMLIEAIPQLPENVKLILPGRGELLEQCRALAESLGVGERVIMPGFVSDMPRWYKACDIAVSASRSEGLPFNVMEALHFGLPVVASAVKGHTDLVEDGINGLLFSFDDGNEFKNAVLRLTDRSALYDKLSSNAAASVEQYGIERVMPVVMSEYLSLLAGQGIDVCRNVEYSLSEK